MQERVSRVQIPEALSNENVTGIVFRLQQLDHTIDQVIEINFSQMRSFDLFAGLYFAVCINSLSKEKNLKIRIIGQMRNSFGEFIGFHQALRDMKLPVIYSLPDVGGTTARYLKMFACPIPSAISPENAMQDMARISGNISDRLIPAEVDVSARWCVRTAIKEVLLNITQHATTDKFFVCALYSSRNFDERDLQNTAEFAIIDQGDGLTKSLSRNPKYKDIKVDTQAINLCMTKGVSRFEGLADRPYDNRGLGLYLLSKFAQCGRGRFIIATGKTGRSLTKSTIKDDEGWFANNSPGTALGVRLDLNFVDRFISIANATTYNELQKMSAALSDDDGDPRFSFDK